MNITCDHTPFAQARVLAITNMHAVSISRVFDLLACMDAQLSIVENEFSSSQLSTCQHPAKCNCSLVPLK